VPLAITGEAPGVVEGGVLDQVTYEVEIESLPGDIPQEVTLDVSNLGLTENLTLADVSLTEDIILVSDPEVVAVTVTPPTEITEEEIEAAGIIEEPSDVEAGETRVEEETEEIPVEERETGPAGQNLQP
jgi:large subunit ribosomal protein L25